MLPLIDLKEQYESIRDELRDAVLRTLDSRQFILGKEVAAFEKEFSSYCQADHGIGVNSGTSALHLSLLAAGVGPGDEVTTVPFTFIATASTIYHAGARPVFVDIESETYTMDPNRLEEAITPRTRAIMPVHLYGQAADMDPILEIAKRHNLTVIEDAAQAHGAFYRGARVGSIGQLGCFSFYPSKNVGACGEGGAVTTNRDDYAKRIRSLRDWSQDGKYVHSTPGFNARMDGIQGAILGVKLRHLEDWNAKRQAAAAQYKAELADTSVLLPTVREGCSHVYHVFCVRTDNRDELAEHLAKNNIGSGIHYPVPLHLQPAFSDLGHKRGDFPVAESCSKTVLSLPMFPEISEQSVSQVCDAVKEFL